MVRDKLYKWGLSAVWIATLAFIFYDSPPTDWGATQLISGAISVALILGLTVLLSRLDIFAKHRGMGEARFDKDGKLIEDE